MRFQAFFKTSVHVFPRVQAVDAKPDPSVRAQAAQLERRISGAARAASSGGGGQRLR